MFLLSNINDLHERWIADYMTREHGIFDYENKYFDGIYFSHLIRLRKPDREYFEYVLADAQLKPEECIFFDDLAINVEGTDKPESGVWRMTFETILKTQIGHR